MPYAMPSPTPTPYAYGPPPAMGGYPLYGAEPLYSTAGSMFPSPNPICKVHTDPCSMKNARV